MQEKKEIRGFTTYHDKTTGRLFSQGATPNIEMHNVPENIVQEATTVLTQLVMMAGGGHCKLGQSFVLNGNEFTFKEAVKDELWTVVQLLPVRESVWGPKEIAFTEYGKSLPVLWEGVSINKKQTGAKEVPTKIIDIPSFGPCRCLFITDPCCHQTIVLPDIGTVEYRPPLPPNLVPADLTAHQAQQISAMGLQ